MNAPSAPPNGGSWQQAVWSIVRAIPRGRVATYGQIARLAPLPGGVDPEDYRAFGARWVGAAMAACPPDAPWQRVLNAKGRVDLKQFGWSGPDEPEQAALF